MLRRALTLGMLPGLLLFALLFAAGTYSLAQLKADPDPDTARVLEHFSTKVYLTLARIGLVHLWVGVVLGALAGLGVALLHPRLLERRVAFLSAAFLVLAVFCAYLTSRLLIRQPTFFDQFLLAQGGPGRWLQVQLTDHVGLRGLDLAAVALHVGGAEGDGRVLLRVEEVGRAQVAVAVRVPGVDGADVDRDLGGRRGRVLGVDVRRRGVVLELTADLRHHRVAGSEAEAAVRGVEHVVAGQVAQVCRGGLEDVGVEGLGEGAHEVSAPSSD